MKRKIFKHPKVRRMAGGKYEKSLKEKAATNALSIWFFFHLVFLSFVVAAAVVVGMRACVLV